MEFGREPTIEMQERQKAATLKEFAISNQITEELVWEMIEEGQLSARFINDTILIFRESEPLMEAMPLVDLNEETPEILIAPHRELQQPPSPVPHLSLKAREDAPQEIKEEEELDFPQHEASSELLLFAQDSIARTMELSQQLIATKDELLRLKDEKISFLEKHLQDKEVEMRQLKREVENLHTLQKIAKNPQMLRTLLPEDV